MKMFMAGMLDNIYLKEVSEQQAKDKPHIYFSTFEGAKKEMLKRIWRDIAEKQGLVDQAQDLYDNITLLKESDVIED